MPRYYFLTVERNGHRETSEASFEFPDDSTAIAQARTALIDMAAEALPNPSINMMSVEVLDEKREPLSEIRLTVNLVPKRL